MRAFSSSVLASAEKLRLAANCSAAETMPLAPISAAPACVAPPDALPDHSPLQDHDNIGITRRLYPCRPCHPWPASEAFCRLLGLPSQPLDHLSVFPL